MAGPSSSSSQFDQVGGQGQVPGTGLEIPVLPENATNEEKDAHWFKYVYQGDRMKQLTPRAVIMGGVLGMLMAASNLYTTLAIGWAFGVAITACVMSYVIWNSLRAATGGNLSKMSILENNCMASTASAAGYSTGATIATMFGALLMLEPIPDGKTAVDVKSWDIQPVWVVAAFTLCTGLMGVFLAIPLKRQMINHEQLRFPSGVAAAATLKNLYAESKEAMYGAYVLVAGIFAGFVVGVLNTIPGTLAFLDTFFEKMKGAIGFDVRLPEMVPHDGIQKHHNVSPAAFGFEPSVLLIGAGIITRMRVSMSMLFGSCLLYFVVGPYLVDKDVQVAGTGWVTSSEGVVSYDKTTILDTVVRNIDLTSDGFVLKYTTWSLWGGTALMVFASLTALALQWKSIVRAFSMQREVEGQSVAEAQAMKNIEVPNFWMVLGMVPLTIAMVIVQVVAFDIQWWAGLIAVAMCFILSLVACRATGETDTTPIGAMGKVMQLLFAGLAPGNISANLASAGIAANSASSAADLLTDLKSGYVLGANPRKQFIAQFLGVFFGTLAIVPVWFLMVPNKDVLEKFAAPATRQWEAVARVLTKGIDYLPESAKYAIVIGAVLGILLPVIDKLAPAKVRGYLPSAMGLGLSWVIPFSSALGFAVGAIIGKVWELLGKRSSDMFAIAIASGLIAGESLTKAMVAILATITGLMTSAPTPTP